MNAIKTLGLLPLFCLVLTSCGGGGGSPAPGPVPPVANLAPVVGGSQAVDLLEGLQLSETYSFSDPENDSITTSLSGDDAALMALSSDGNLTFSQVPDFEAAADINADNVYDVNIVASDGANETSYAISITVANATEGRVVDGPVSGSVVFVDINGDGVQGSDEPMGTTDGNGYFSFAETPQGITGTAVIAIGGTDTQTGVELESLTLISEISTSADVVAVTPLTTVLVGLPDDTQKLAFLTAIGLESTPASLLTSDGWAAAQSGDAASQAEQRASQQIAVVLQGVSALTADNVTKTVIEQAQVVAAKIAKASQEQANFSLSSTDSIQTIVEASLNETAPGVYTDTTLLTAVAQSVAAVNTVVADATVDPTSVLAGEVALAVQVDMQGSLGSLASGDIDTSSYTEQTGLATLLADATIPADAPDQDGDGISDILDNDNDGDGVVDTEDVFPNDETETTDTDGDGVGNNVDEDVPPVITLNGAAVVNHEQGTSYTDAGATATDTVEGTLTVTVSGVVDSTIAGSYILTYTVSDSAGNSAVAVSRTVIVSDTTAPVISLAGSSSVTHEQGTSYTDPGATSSDSVEGSLTVVITGTVDTATAGTYTLTYTATDSMGNTTAVTRAVTVSDTTAPVISLAGSSSVTHEQGTSYTDPGATSSDSVEGSLTVVITGTVDTATAGTYTLTYTATDSMGNVSNVVTRTVTVSDTIAPVITFDDVDSDFYASATSASGYMLTDDNISYVTGLFSAIDAVDGSIAVTGFPSSGLLPIGINVFTATATDAAGNVATFTFTIGVFDDGRPNLDIPDSISVDSTDGLGVSATQAAIAAFLSAATANDEIDGVVTVTTDAPATFPLGSTTVTFTAVDAGGNKRTKTAVVTVLNLSSVREGYTLPTAITVIETVE